MNVAELIKKLSLTVFVDADPLASVCGGYCGDLLSWVMGRARKGDAWVTIMSNRNVAAVAQLTECACVILAENVLPDAELSTLSREHGINVLGSPQSSFALCDKIAELLRG